MGYREKMRQINEAQMAYCYGDITQEQMYSVTHPARAAKMAERRLRATAIREAKMEKFCKIETLKFYRGLARNGEMEVIR